MKDRVVGFRASPAGGRVEAGAHEPPAARGTNELDEVSAGLAGSATWREEAGGPVVEWRGHLGLSSRAGSGPTPGSAPPCRPPGEGAVAGEVAFDQPGIPAMLTASMAFEDEVLSVFEEQRRLIHLGPRHHARTRAARPRPIVVELATRGGLARGMGSVSEALVLAMSPYRVRPPLPPDGDELEGRGRQRRVLWLGEALLAILEVVVATLLQ